MTPSILTAAFGYRDATPAMHACAHNDDPPRSSVWIVTEKTATGVPTGTHENFE